MRAGTPKAEVVERQCLVRREGRAPWPPVGEEEKVHFRPYEQTSGGPGPYVASKDILSVWSTAHYHWFNFPQKISSSK